MTGCETSLPARDAAAGSTMAPEVSDYLGSIHPMLSRALIYIILTFVVAALFWMWLGKVDVVASAPFRLVPLGQVHSLQAPRDGQIELIGVGEGDWISEGDVVLKLRSRETLRELLELDRARKNLEKARYEVEKAVPRRLALLRETIEGLTRRLALTRELARVHRVAVESCRGLPEGGLRSGLGQVPGEQEASLEDRIQFRTAEMEYLKKRFEQSRMLHTKGLISRTQLDESRVHYFSALAELPARMGEIDRFETTILDLRRRILEANLELDRVSRQARDDCDEAELAYERACQVVDRDLDEELDLILAPESGVVTRVWVNSDGQVVSKGQALIAFAPSDVPLVAEASIRDRDIGTLEVGQIVRLKYEAFPFADHGIRRGVLTRVSPEAMVDPLLGPVFQGTIELEETAIFVGGAARPLMYGMKGTAEIVTGRQSVLSLVVRPLRELQRSAGFESEREAL